ncbi:hypothetical protein [Polaribacter sp. Hel_I_88]|nr:hypothetical protein [Polaribacter sp. Hel_I_88]
MLLDIVKIIREKEKQKKDSKTNASLSSALVSESRNLNVKNNDIKILSL